MRRRLHVSRSIKTIGCTLLCLPILFAVAGTFVHVFASARAVAHERTCTANVKQILMGTLQYAQDWEETLPPSRQWATLSNKYIRQSPEAAVWHCTEAPSSYSYAFNRALGGLSRTDLDEASQTVCLFESDATTWNAAGGAQQLAKEHRHAWEYRYGFVDGHVNGFRASQLRWQPLVLPKEKQP